MPLGGTNGQTCWLAEACKPSSSSADQGNVRPLRVSVSVSVDTSDSIGIASGMEYIQPQLQGQTQASANISSGVLAGNIGNINISDLVLEAVPGAYLLSVTLLDNPQVTSDHHTLCAALHVLLAAYCIAVA